MVTPRIPQLGRRILVVMDKCDACLEILQQMAQVLPDVADREFTLIHCVPPIYWEHSGQRDSGQPKDFREAKEKAFRSTQDYFAKASQILMDSGVTQHAVHTIMDCKASDTTRAVLKELRTRPYTGVIMSHYHRDLADLLTGRSVVGWFVRNKPKVTVWVIDREFAPG